MLRSICDVTNLRKVKLRFMERHHMSRVVVTMNDEISLTLREYESELLSLQSIEGRR